MAIESDVLVVGGGLAGSMAAIAASEAGASVRLVSATESTLRQASGLVDVLGYVDGEGPVTDPFAAIDSLSADHPYRLLGENVVREAMACFDTHVDGYRGAHTDANALVPTHGGTVKPTARYPNATAAGLASDPENTLLVGFESLTDFDAPLVAESLDGPVPFDVRGTTISFPVDLRADAKCTRYAACLEQSIHGTGTGDAIEALGGAIRPALDEATRVGFPAILGRDDPADVRSRLSEELDLPVFEVPMGAPSVPGLRLADSLESALLDAGVALETGNPVVDYEGKAHVDHVVVDREGNRVPYHADQFVLATGGLVGAGIRADRTSVREPVFGCHVPHPDDRYGWSGERAFDDHRFARFGVDVGPSLKPRTADGDVELSNLRAAGSVVGGYDFAAEHSGSGISIATGVAAGRGAAREGSS